MINEYSKTIFNIHPGMLSVKQMALLLSISNLLTKPKVAIGGLILPDMVFVCVLFSVCNPQFGLPHHPEGY